ncbi:MLO-like protein 4 isoform X2 [Spinacia oleracea]|uniref:MLO-like protein n=1 Tax=Spinacia oleracea TaxID=3562 RepID=A0A9R0JE38_SPIOL|nr:MLO-like protein 4 isoform X2 [Spinacia oleracea]
MLREGKSLAETPTWSVATVTSVMVFVCFLVERSIYWFGKWLKKTRRKALFASLEKIKEELMLLGLISLMLGQWARWISEICVDSSLFNSRFYACSEKDFTSHEKFVFKESLPSSNETDIPPKGLFNSVSHRCPEGREPFVSYEGLEQLHRFLFVLGITHVLYSCIAVGLAMIKIYSWKKWEFQAILQAKRNKVMRRQTTFAFHHASHPWSRNRFLIWMNHKLPQLYDFHKYMVRSMEDEFHTIVGISWPLWGYAIVCILLNVHGLNIYFWLSFIPVILVILVGTKLEHVVSLLALEIAEPSCPSTRTQVKPRDELFWFGKPQLILWLIQFVSFQNAFEMATFLWSLWGFEQRSCFMKNHAMVIIRLASGVLIQFWCSYSTVPLSVIITQMGSKCKKALVAESVRDSLHNWCKRVKEKSRRSLAARSVCSLDEIDEVTTVASLTLSRTSSVASLNEVKVTDFEHPDQATIQNSTSVPDDFSFRMSEYISQSALNTFPDTPHHTNPLSNQQDQGKFDTLADLLQKT